MTTARVSGVASQILFGSQSVRFAEGEPRGSFVTLDGERYYAIEGVEAMPPFFMTVVSESDHWLFVSSTGGLTAGRRNSQHTLFPYYTEDKITENYTNTGPATVIFAKRDGAERVWEPFRPHTALAYATERRLYKSLLGNRLVFEEVNRDLNLVFRYAWTTGHKHGFVRQVAVENLSSSPTEIRICDGLLNIMPADVNNDLQLGFSCLVDAYKTSELLKGTTLGVFCLQAQVTDRALPIEVLRANTVFCLGADNPTVLLSEEQLEHFRRGSAFEREQRIRGGRGAYLVAQSFGLGAHETKRWLIVADVSQTQTDVLRRKDELCRSAELRTEIEKGIEEGNRRLRAIVAQGDGFQKTSDEAATAHHIANAMFNLMRGGVFAFGYEIPSRDFAQTIKTHSLPVFERCRGFLESLPLVVSRSDLEQRVRATGDAQLERLFQEYLPLTFSRRHGDPSRPWNRFDIRVRNRNGDAILAYEGNWRDVFQNWHALSQSYPEFIEHFIAKFVNASTPDGYNPYRVTKDGIDWEAPSPDDPFANIGYWGDHQVIYLLALLEQSKRYHPGQLQSLLTREIYSFANVPYIIKPYAQLRANPRDSIVFDSEKHAAIAKKVVQFGADGKLVIDERGDVYRANLAEKLALVVLARMAAFVPFGGLWMHTQRPEWNDANNALVGYGLSVVTLCHLERFLRFAIPLFDSVSGTEARISVEIAEFMGQLGSVLAGAQSITRRDSIDDAERGRIVDALQDAAARYRAAIYSGGFTSKRTVRLAEMREFFALCLSFVEHSVRHNQRPDGLFHAYNLLKISPSGMGVEHLYEMLEGQAAALSTLAFDPKAISSTLAALANSRMYRPDQNSYTLYPDRDLPGFLERNVVALALVESCPILTKMIAERDERVIAHDPEGALRFDSSLTSAGAIRERLDQIRKSGDYASFDAEDWEKVVEVYEEAFNHRAFTGRSGTMFAYEGLGCIYWHMIGKLLLAVQENALAAVERGAKPELIKELALRYHTIRKGVAGYNKTPSVYGAFPTDPYSHTPRQSGARQPGMTGQVKEEVIARLGELGVSVSDGILSFHPWLLRPSEFLRTREPFEYVDAAGNSRTIELEPGTLGFTVCQVPVVYHHDPAKREVVVQLQSSGSLRFDGTSLDQATSRAVFERRDTIARIDVWTAPLLPGAEALEGIYS